MSRNRNRRRKPNPTGLESLLGPLTTFAAGAVTTLITAHGKHLLGQVIAKFNPAPSVHPLYVPSSMDFARYLKSHHPDLATLPIIQHGTLPDGTHEVVLGLNTGEVLAARVSSRGEMTFKVVPRRMDGEVSNDTAHSYNPPQPVPTPKALADPHTPMELRLQPDGTYAPE